MILRTIRSMGDSAMNCRDRKCAVQFALSVAMTLGTVVSSATAATSAIAPPAAPHVHVTTPFVRNPHLKGVESRATHATSTTHKDDHGMRDHHIDLHHAWRHRWDYESWMVIHRGLGTIRGVVHGREGAPMTSVHMVLRKPHGGTFVRVSRRHITYTDAGGNFFMSGVRVGKYRVLASRGKMRGHVQVAVHPGSTANVSVKI
jgi:Carboxypeptidase regulatory-like domain